MRQAADRTGPGPGRRAAAVVAALTLGLVACTATLSNPRDPTLVGVVQGLDFVAGNTADIHLTSGVDIRIDLEEVRSLHGSGPVIGDLLIYGERPSPWRASLGPSPHGGFEVRSQPDDSDDGSITLDFGVRLPLAPGYKESDSGPMEQDAPVLYIVDERGAVSERP